MHTQATPPPSRNDAALRRRPGRAAQVYHSAGLARPRLVLTIHNMDNTGEVGRGAHGLVG